MMSDEEEKDDPLRELLREALNLNVDKRKLNKNQTELVETVQAVVSEFLDSFIIVGYDFEGQPISIEGMTNPQQRDAMETLFLKYFCYRTGYKIPGMDENDFEF